ncbi:MAG: sodium:solute symporter [Bacteroidales bacterium]|nr:sodium:solute symporter [Bacteroidales bacterium]
MTPVGILITMAAYFAAMLFVSRMAAGGGENSAFFRGRRNTGWWVVAFAMIGSCMSGVTFVSVPGMVGVSGMAYLQMCMGFFLGYMAIAFVLVPLYFRLNVYSIYQYLEGRFGLTAYKTGAWFFFLSKMLGASVRLYLVCLILQMLAFGPLGLPFVLNVFLAMIVVLAYTRRGGVNSLVWTDVLRTGCMLTAVVLTLVFIARDLGLDLLGMVEAIRGSEMSRVFHFDDINHPQYFWKQFLGGLFTVIAMTGLDQDMMQHTLCCKSPSDSQKNLIVSTLLQNLVIFFFLCLGVLLYLYADANGIRESGDRLFPAVATDGRLPAIVGILFTIGLTASAFGAGGSALTALTTSFTVDILGTGGKDETAVRRTRNRVHLAMAAGMGAVILIFSKLNSTSAIDAVYKLASYTYGPILGMFAFGVLTRRRVKDRRVPLVAVLSPLICLVLQLNSERWFGGYRFSYELLPLNAALTFAGLRIFCTLPSSSDTR